MRLGGRWLRRHGIRELLDVVVARDDVRKVKPDPELFLLAAARLGVRARRLRRLRGFAERHARRARRRDALRGRAERAHTLARATRRRPRGRLARRAAARGASRRARARVSLDLKDAPVQDIVRLLAELGGFQVVFDPGVECKLTLRLHEARWLAVLDTTLRACGLGYEEEGDILRVAKTSRLMEESAARRRLEEERAQGGSGRITLFRLS